MAADPRFVPPDLPRDPGRIWTRSIVSSRTGRGVVVVEWNAEAGQFDPEDARIFAHTVLRECDNAETDAFLYNFLKNTVGLDGPALATLLVEYRAHRARLEKLAGLRRSEDPIPEGDAR